MTFITLKREYRHLSWPFAFGDVDHIVNETFGQDIATLFQSFDQQPVASASLPSIPLRAKLAKLR